MTLNVFIFFEDFGRRRMHVDIDIERFFNIIFKFAAPAPGEKRMCMMPDAFDNFTYMPLLGLLA
jgi:hypothetical protein